MLVPKILYGSTKTTRAAWSKVIRKALISEAPLEIFDQLELVEIDNTNELIIVQELAGGWKTEENVWHFNWLHTRWLFPDGDGHAAWREQFRTVMAGLDLPWYHFGMLFSHFTDFYFTRIESVQSTTHGSTMCWADVQQNILLPWLDKLLSRVEKMNRYSSRFRYTYPLCEPTILENASWLRGILLTAYQSGISDLILLQECYTMTFHQMIDKLLATGRVEKAENGLRLKDMPNAPLWRRG